MELLHTAGMAISRHVKNVKGMALHHKLLFGAGNVLAPIRVVHCGGDEPGLAALWEGANCKVRRLVRFLLCSPRPDKEWLEQFRKRREGETRDMRDCIAGPSIADGSELPDDYRDVDFAYFGTRARSDVAAVCVIADAITPRMTLNGVLWIHSEAHPRPMTDAVRDLCQLNDWSYAAIPLTQRATEFIIHPKHSLFGSSGGHGQGG